MVEIVTLAGDKSDVARLAEGRVALVSFWATWCEGCMKEIDALNRLYARTAAGHDAVVIGVAVGEPAATVAEFASRRGLRYPLLVDEEFALADALGQRRVPATLVVDRHGAIVHRGESLDAAALEAMASAVAQAQAQTR
jgi:peroxiredoxin